jgi:hypothetical protein
MSVITVEDLRKYYGDPSAVSGRGVKAIDGIILQETSLCLDLGWVNSYGYLQKFRDRDLGVDFPLLQFSEEEHRVEDGLWEMDPCWDAALGQPDGGAGWGHARKERPPAGQRENRREAPGQPDVQAECARLGRAHAHGDQTRPDFSGRVAMLRYSSLPAPEMGSFFVQSVCVGYIVDRKAK